MRAYSKRINLIQIANKKLEIVNQLLKNNGYNEIYYIESTDVDSKDISRAINDLDSLAEPIPPEEEYLLHAYLEARCKLDSLRMHIRATNKRKKKHPDSK